jgi:uncharacterized delta-60 repeat protein
MSDTQNAVMRLLPSGAVDREYGKDGVAAFGDMKTGYATRAALAPDGSVIAGGYEARAHRGFVARIAADGRPDPAFGKNGIVFVDEPKMTSAWAVAVDPKGRPLLAGSTETGAAVLRFQPDGSVDRSFGEDGVAWSDRAGSDQFYALSFDSSENVIGVGFRDLAEDAAALVVRFRSNGALDTGFGTGGRIVHQLDGGTFVYAAVWAPNGGLVAAGDVWKGRESRALMLRIR